MATTPLLLNKYKKYIFVNLNEELNDVQLKAIKETYELGKSLPINNPVKDFLPVDDNFAQAITTYLLAKVSNRKGNVPSLSKVVSRIHTDHEGNIQVIVLNSDEYKEILTGYLSDLKSLITSLAQQCKELMTEYATISALSTEAKRISDSLGGEEPSSPIEQQ